MNATQHTEDVNTFDIDELMSTINAAAVTILKQMSDCHDLDSARHLRLAANSLYSANDYLRRLK